MKIIDLTKENEELYFKCLEDWSDEMKESGNHKACWYEKMKDKGLGVKLALDEQGKAGGMIQYIPIEYSTAEGEDLFFIPCIWVHGYKKGRGNFQKKGMGKALLRAAEEDARAKGAKGMAAWGITLPFWMKASWYKKHGYKKVDKNGMAVLVWKPLEEDAKPPRWIRAKKRPQKEEGKVVVTAFINGWCPAQNIVYERAKRAAAELGEGVEFQKINTFDRETFLEWGISDEVYVDDKKMRNGPPASYKTIHKHIAKRLKKIKA